MEIRKAIGIGDGAVYLFDYIQETYRQDIIAAKCILLNYMNDEWDTGSVSGCAVKFIKIGAYVLAYTDLDACINERE